MTDPQMLYGTTTDRPRRNLYVYNGGFLTQPRIRRILSLAGWDIRIGKPGDGDWIGVWGQSPTAPRGERVAGLTGNPILRVEDPFFRSVRTGRDGDPPLGLLLDESGLHFDPSTPSDLERILAEDPLDDSAILNRARDAIDRIKATGLSKYNTGDPALAPPDPGYVLILDQTRGDASVTASGCDLNSFREMLFYAQDEHPRARILIKTHPETTAGHRPGYFDTDAQTDRIQLINAPHTPARLLEGAIAVYTVSSQMGFEAILAGHRPVVFGQPFYMGWGLTDDRKPLDRRQRSLTRAQLAAAALILYPHWHSPYHDRAATLEDTLDTLEAQSRAYREDRNGSVAHGFRLWKRAPTRRFLQGPVRFRDDPAKALAAVGDAQRLLSWSSRTPPELEAANAIRVEDGFLRSRGLGAELIPPLSLAFDDLGIYYDPGRESRLERLIAASETLSDPDHRRAEALIRRLRNDRLSKYNLPGTLPDLPGGHRILVTGQVEDDASILTGTGAIRTNTDLLKAVRDAHPDAILIYKPHPDVEAGLRPGAIDATLADITATNADPIALIEATDEVHTMTSLLGFEALIRRKPLTCYGTPFYAGWGLTTDRDAPCPRRTATPSLEGLVHAALIAYPRYHDPVTNLPCPPEIALDRLATGDLPQPGKLNRLTAKLQGLFASTPFWR
ncbi:capsular polysaccharide biosynthesis protein [Aestuariibius sp. 2305UL40-4]|uniref:capsular polysaccharide biosynthesis protein n=1 Tax=Aestuariibius violaceus TaxID=3234132 RepID=UPI00345F1551